MRKKELTIMDIIIDLLVNEKILENTHFTTGSFPGEVSLGMTRCKKWWFVGSENFTGESEDCRPSDPFFMEI
eukprot:UN08993